MDKYPDGKELRHHSVHVVADGGNFFDFGARVTPDKGQCRMPDIPLSWRPSREDALVQMVARMVAIGAKEGQDQYCTCKTS